MREGPDTLPGPRPLPNRYATGAIMPGPPSRRYCSCGTRLASDHREVRCAKCLRHEQVRDAAPPDLPLAFWQTDQLRDAFGSQHIGLVSVAYRLHPFHRRPISQERLGLWLGLTQAQISRIESGPPIRDLDRLGHWAVTLGLPQYLLWFDLPGRHRTNAPRLPIPSVEASRVPASAWSPPAAAPHAELRLHVDTIRAAARAFRAADRQLGSGSLYPVVTRYLQTDVFPRLVGHGQHEPAAFAAAASLTDMAGWLAYDDDRHERARQHFAQAFGLATAAGDPALSAQTLVSQSHLALEHERPSEAVRLAEAGLALVPDGPDCAPLRCRLHTMSARGSALLGDDVSCRAALDAAESELHEAHHDEHEWLSPFDAAALAAETAVCRRDLGHLQAAARQANIVLSLRGPDRVRSRSFAQLTLATVHIRQGDFDAAATVGTNVLDLTPHLASQRVVQQLRSLGQALHPHAGVPAVAAFREQLVASLPAPRPATP